eukprot:2097298-Rhodomonas_salina.1
MPRHVISIGTCDTGRPPVPTKCDVSTLNSVMRAQDCRGVDRKVNKQLLKVGICGRGLDLFTAQPLSAEQLRVTRRGISYHER